MTKTIQIAADRAHDQAKTVLPAEVARAVYIANPPGPEALKLMHLMIGAAGGRMAEDVQHELRLAEIKKIDGMRNHTRATLRELFVKLAGTVMVFDDTEARCEIIGGFLDRAKLDYRQEVSDDLLVTWWFGGAFRSMAEKSCHWAIMDRQTIFALRSKYSILLYQHIASLTALDHITDKTFTVPELRVVCGVPDKKLGRFADLRRFVIESAIAEINQLSRLTLTATPNKIGRTVASVTIAWAINPDLIEAKRELDRSNIGRKVRLQGTAETPIVAFPASGSIRFLDPWERLARENCNWDHGKIADAFRAWCRKKKIKLDAIKIEQKFVNFCASQKTI